jgi:hypothetical protein
MRSRSRLPLLALVGLALVLLLAGCGSADKKITIGT